MAKHDPMFGLGARQKPREDVRAFWNSTALWRTTYFDDLRTKGAEALPACLRAEREFVIAEHGLVGELATRHDGIAEFGCGVGRSLLPFIREFPSTYFVGIDDARDQVALFQRQIATEGHRRAAALVADVGQVPLRDGSVECVLICNQTFGTFLGETRTASLREARRLLARGGNLFIGGFTNLALAAECYAAWNVPLESIDYDTGLVCLAPYKSLWQDEASVVALVEAEGFALRDSRHVEIGFLDLFAPA